MPPRRSRRGAPDAAIDVEAEQPRRRKSRRGEPEEVEEVDAPEEAASPQRRRPAPADDAAAEANKRRRLKLYRDEQTGKYPQDPEGDAAQRLSITGPPAVPEGETSKDKEELRANELDSKELDALVSKMARYLLLRGTKKLPVVRSKLADATLGDYKKLRITNFVMAKAAKLLWDAWGYEVVQAPPRCGDFEYKGSAKDAWYVVHARKRRDPRHAELVAAQLPEGERAARGLLLAVLSVVQANSGAVRETELYRRLHAMDPRVPDEPLAKSSSRNEVSGLGNVALLLESFQTQHYLIPYKDPEDEQAFQLGPRALVDVGRYQVAQFASDALGHEAVDGAIIREIADSIRDPDAQKVDEAELADQ